MVSRFALALLMAATPCNAQPIDSHKLAGHRETRSANHPVDVKQISITANGARSNDVSGDESIALCSNFRLSAKEVREFFANASRVDERAYYHDLEMSRCHAAGVLTFANGEHGRWQIDMQRRGMVVLANGQRRYLYCAKCKSKQYDEVYDPDRDF